MSPHLRRVLALRLAIAALALALPACWVIGRARIAGRRIRYRRRGPRVPGLPADGEPLDVAECAAFLVIVRGWKHAAPERTRT